MKDQTLINLFHELSEMEGEHAEWLEKKLGLTKGKSHE
jgi:bacterioferritin (cytochrome b1)